MTIFNDKLKKWKEHCRIVQQSTLVNPGEPVALQIERIARAKRDFNYFVETYFPHYASSRCADFHIRAANEIKKDRNIFAVLEWPREHAKSVFMDIFIPLWLKIMGEGQLDGMILGGKNWDDACGLLSDTQAELQFNQLYIHDFGPQYAAGSWEDGDFITADGIEFIAIGRGQSPRGIRNREKRPNYGVLDDIDDDEIVQNPDRSGRVVDWILGSFYGALRIKNSRLMMGGNRIHKHSILAQIVGDTEPEKPKRKGIYHSKVLAIENGIPAWKENFTNEELQRKFDRMGYYLSQREFFHNPVVKGKIFKSEWIQWGPVPPLNQMDKIVAYLDPSYKAKTTNDFKAIRMWGKKGINLYLVKSFVRQTSITEAVKWLYDLHENIPTDVICDYFMEQVFLQDMFYDDFEQEARARGYFLPIRGDTRKKPDKFSRIQSLTPYYERGIVTYNELQRKDPDMQTGLDQVLGFEKGTTVHDDAPDADEGAINILQKYGRSQTSKPRIGVRKQTRGW